MNARDVADGAWKVIAIGCISLLVGIATTGLGWFSDARDRPSRAEVRVISDRQLDVLTRLAVIENEIVELRRILAVHMAATP